MAKKQDGFDSYRDPARPMLADVLGAIENVYGVDRRNILGPGQAHDIANLRHVAMWLGIYLCGRTPAWLSQAMDRDRSTVLSSLRRVRSLLAHDEQMAERIERVRLAAWACQRRRLEGYAALAASRSDSQSRQPEAQSA